MTAFFQQDKSEVFQDVSKGDFNALGKVGVVFVGWILSLCLFSFLLPNPKKGWLVGAILCVAVVLSIGLPLAMFFR